MEFIDTRFGLDTKVSAQFLRYANGQLALELTESQTREPWDVATVAVQEGCPDDCITVKDWSEAEGMPQILQQAGLIETMPVKRIRSGFVAIPVYKLTEAGRALAAQADTEHADGD